MHQNWTLTKQLGNKLWTVDKEFIWYLDYEEKDYYIKVEKWFTSDFWSIPRLLWFIFDKTKFVSYILHDKLYNNHRVWREISPWVYESKELTRKECDMILLEWLNLEWANIFEKTFIYLWVRIGWWLSFKK